MRPANPPTLAKLFSAIDLNFAITAKACALLLKGPPKISFISSTSLFEILSVLFCTICAIAKAVSLSSAAYTAISSLSTVKLLISFSIFRYLFLDSESSNKSSLTSNSIFPMPSICFLKESYILLPTPFSKYSNKTVVIFTNFKLASY